MIKAMGEGGQMLFLLLGYRLWAFCYFIRPASAYRPFSCHEQSVETCAFISEDQVLGIIFFSSFLDNVEMEEAP